MNVLDLFSGAGGLAEGFWQEGFDVVAHVEKEKWMCETLKTREMYHFLERENDLAAYYEYLKQNKSYREIETARKSIYEKYPEFKLRVGANVICKAFGDPRYEPETFSVDDIIRSIEESMSILGENKVDVVIGGPPCQAFSTIARHIQNKKQNDTMMNLYTYYMTILKHFQPKMFVFENVVGLISILEGDIYSEIMSQFDQAGYKLLCFENGNFKNNILNATSFGVCQNRKRVILIGVKKNSKENQLLIDYRRHLIYKFDSSSLTTSNAIGDLPKIKAGENLDNILYPYDTKATSEFQKCMRKNSPGVINHKARPNLTRDLEIYRRHISKETRRYRDLPENLKTHKKQDIFEDRFRVHYNDEVPHTIVAHISRDGHYNIHPDIDQCRSLTVREAARIQSFPDNYKFEGPRTSQFTQVGNAVPPIMAQTIARVIKDTMRRI